MNVINRTKENKQTGCLEWLMSKTSAGYGQLKVQGEHYLAHRVSYEQNIGPIPEGLIVRHLCHNKICLNPSHLALGTHKDNYKDSLEVHSEANRTKSNIIEINGIKYLGMRAAQAATSLTFHSLVKYTKEGVFDVSSYRIATKKAGRTPKV